MDSILNPTRKNRERPRRISADAAILSVDEGKLEFTGVVGEKLTGDRKINVQGVVLHGRWWHPR